MLDPKLVGRSAMERTKLRYRTDVGLLGARRQIAHRHVVDHALAQRRDRPGHRKLLSNWTARTRSPRRQEGICRYPTPIEMSRGQKGNCGNVRQKLSKYQNQHPQFGHQTPPQENYRGSGLVQRDVMEYVAVPSSFRLRARELDHLGPFLRFLDDEFAEVGR